MDNIFIQICYQIWTILTMAGPYILFGFLMAGLIHTFIPPAKIVSLLGQKNWKSVFMASMCGIPLPLCSCSVLPTAATLREKGASRGATSAFLISTPETGVDSIALTYGIMDVTMAILRPLSAFITALISGIFVNIWGESKEDDPAPQAKESCGCCQNSSPTSESCSNSSPKKQSWIKNTIRYAFWDLSDGLSHWLAIGLVLSGVIAAVLPNSIFDSWAGQGFSSLLLMLAISTPMYICASASTPIAAVMIVKGLSPGAALVFLLAGPATNIGSIPVLLKILGRRSTVIYLLSIVIVSLSFGFIVNTYYSTYSIMPTMAIHTHGEEHHGLLGLSSGLFLLILLLKGMIFRPVPAEWRKLNNHLYQISGFQLSWFKISLLILFLAVLSYFWQ